MKVLRIIIPVLLLFASVPLFALPCSICDFFEGHCVLMPDALARCNPFTCVEHQDLNCSPLAPTTPLASELTIASVEVVTPARHTVKTTTVRVASKQLR